MCILWLNATTTTTTTKTTTTTTTTTTTRSHVGPKHNPQRQLRLQPWQLSLPFGFVMEHVLPGKGTMQFALRMKSSSTSGGDDASVGLPPWAATAPPSPADVAWASLACWAPAARLAADDDAVEEKLVKDRLIDLEAQMSRCCDMIRGLRLEQRILKAEIETTYTWTHWMTRLREWFGNSMREFLWK